MSLLFLRAKQHSFRDEEGASCVLAGVLMVQDTETKAKTRDESSRLEWKTLAGKNGAAALGPAKRLVIPAWHGPYAVVLLETNLEKLPALIAVAKQEILARYIDELAPPMCADEFLDLRNATEALAQVETGIRSHSHVS